MADLLANLGRIAAKPLADEQLRRLEELHAGVERGSYDRLHIAVRLANTRWAYEQWEDAIALLEPALVEFRAASGGVLPQSANEALSTYVNFLMLRGQYARGEEVYLAELKTPPNTQQRHWLVQQLYALYTGAVSADGRVSLGRGKRSTKPPKRKCWPISTRRTITIAISWPLCSVRITGRRIKRSWLVWRRTCGLSHSSGFPKR